LGLVNFTCRQRGIFSGIFECVKLNKNEVFLCCIKHYSLKAYLRVEVLFRTFLTSILGGGKWAVLRHGRFNRRGRIPWYPLDGMLDDTKSHSGRFIGDKNVCL
jgi:hypothetical protein